MEKSVEVGKLIGNSEIEPRGHERSRALSCSRGAAISLIGRKPRFLKGCRKGFRKGFRWGRFIETLRVHPLWSMRRFRTTVFETGASERNGHLYHVRVCL